MGNPLSHLEDLAEQLVEGTFARILKARLQPIEVARRIARAMEDGQVINARGQVVVPNTYHVQIHPDDLHALSSYQDTLQDELAEYVSGLARKAGATMPGRPRVFLQANDNLTPHRVRVQGRIMSARQESFAAGHTQEMPSLQATPTSKSRPTCLLYDGKRRMPLSEAIITIGRSLDNDIILDDARVSRKHAQLRRRYGQYVLYDLDSTGGTTVNASPIREAVLQPGDVIAFAGVKVRFEQTNVVDTASRDGPADVTRPMPRRRRTGGRT